MTRLSVNINKWATLRNARGGNTPDLLRTASRIQEFGAEGITVHPRPDERHIRYQDAYDLKSLVHTEYNIEGNPIPSFMKMVLAIQPTQVTLVPDGPDALTSDHGWDVVTHQSFLQDVIGQFKEAGIRTSIFLDPNPAMIEGAKQSGTDRIELYTEGYAKHFAAGPQEALAPYLETAIEAQKHGLGINAGHDLNLQNIAYFADNIPDLLEVSIGHALICESIELGLENVIRMYLNRLKTDRE
jgi:pyridoxine 5-phosphate synthase